MPVFGVVLLSIFGWLFAGSLVFRTTFQRALHKQQNAKVDCFEQRRLKVMNALGRAVTPDEVYKESKCRHVYGQSEFGDNYYGHPEPKWPIAAGLLWPGFLIGCLWYLLFLKPVKDAPRYQQLQLDREAAAQLERCQQLLAATEKIIATAPADVLLASAEQIRTDVAQVNRRLDQLQIGSN